MFGLTWAITSDAFSAALLTMSTDTPRLRYLVGEDAKRLVAGRQRMTDEEHVAGGRDMPDAEFLDLLRRRYGFEW